jgi:hypothetical protein
MKQDSARHGRGSWCQALLAVGLAVGLLVGGPAGMGQAHGLSPRTALTRLMTAPGRAATSPSGRTARALLVGTWHDRTRPFRSIQAAVTAARLRPTYEQPIPEGPRMTDPRNEGTHDEK